MLKHCLILFLLAFVWLALSGHYTLLILSLGAMSCVLSYYLYQRVCQTSAKQGLDLVSLDVRPVKWVVYILWLMKEIVVSGLYVLLEVFYLKKVKPEFFKVSTGCLSEIGKVIYANSITLTPGTISVAIEEDGIQVHGLLIGAKQSLQKNTMLNKVEALQNKKKEP